jgi:hypothetical protein
MHRMKSKKSQEMLELESFKIYTCTEGDYQHIYIGFIKYTQAWRFEHS